ncbi:hypothetical protein FHETE_8887 [Fusarium heterosporum]|uniref:Nephrocystin 3-like N-terminal domain-containing protein n=1 Tax=Fusarium heterosporum TaxID=42747 RepID=A0A8H5T1D0_FUSHE|nr:hypothetical protein FHETE_8887 [Fusarium heterosporum]
MSGAEAAIAGVGFLCNAMQIVTFGRDILQVYSHLRDGRSPDPRLEAYLKSAKCCFDLMNDPALVAAQARPLNQDQQQVVEVGKALEDCIDKLQSKFSELHLDDSAKRGFHGKFKMAQKAVASLWQGKEFESLENNLKRYESLLHRVVLHRICNQSQAAEISSNQSFHQLNTVLQSVIAQLANGCTKVSELSIQSLQTRDRVTQEHETTRAAVNEGFDTTTDTLSDFRDSVSQNFQELNNRNHHKDFEKHHEQILESLRFREMNSRKNHVSENYPGTFSWVFGGSTCCSRCHSPSFSDSDSDGFPQLNKTGDSDEHMDNADDFSESASTKDPLDFGDFPAWLESDLKLFWVSGKPASGKSSLMKFLATNPLTLEHLKVRQRNAPMTGGGIHVITHFFWRPGQALQKNVEGMTLSLLYQVLSKNPGLTQWLWENQPDIPEKRARGDWDLKELRETLCRAIQVSGDTFCIFLDGLDEAEELQHLPWPDHKSAQVIPDLLGLSNVKLCASSREEASFHRFFEGRSRLRIHLLTHNDIYHFAEKRLESSGLDPSYRDHLLEKVVEKADGVFLWVTLVLDSLNRAIRSSTTSTEEFDERLAKMPSDVKDLLADMWERPGDDGELSSYRADASRYFNLTIAARKLEEELRSQFPRHFGIIYEESPNVTMSTLLVMATAAEDMPFTSILETGRSIRLVMKF